MAFVGANLYSIGNTAWIGIKASSSQDKWFHWEEGVSPQNICYSNWDSISPRGDQYPNNERRCVAAHWGSAQDSGDFFVGQWRDYPCDASNPDMNPSNSQHSYVCSNPYESGLQIEYPNEYNCPDGWVPLRESCYLYTGQNMAWDQALSTCQAYAQSLPELKGKHVGLPIIRNPYEQSLVYSFFGSDGANRGKGTGALFEQPWLGVTAQEVRTTGDSGGKQFQFKNWDDTVMTYSYWANGEPNHSEIRDGKGCIVMSQYDFSGRSNGQWMIERDQQIPGSQVLVSEF